MHVCMEIAHIGVLAHIGIQPYMFAPLWTHPIIRINAHLHADTHKHAPEEIGQDKRERIG